MKTSWAVLLVFLIWVLFGLWFYEFLGERKQQRAMVNPSIVETINTVNSADSIAQQRAKENSDEPAQSPNTQDTTSLTREAFSDQRNTAQFAKIIEVYRDSLGLNFTLEFADVRRGLIDFLNNDPMSDLAIIGLYDAQEKIMDPNIGRRRSVLLKDMLTESGLPADRLWCDSDIRQMFFKDQLSYLGGVLLMQKARAEPYQGYIDVDPPNDLDQKPSPTNKDVAASDPTETAAISPGVPDPDVVKKPKRVRPRERSVLFYLTIENEAIVMQQSITDLIPVLSQWLNKDPRYSIQIMGHTDNVGHQDDNLVLGLKWANQMRNWLGSTQGLDLERLYIGSAGEERPLFDNQTTNGRFKNRRIELIFKQSLP